MVAFASEARESHNLKSVDVDIPHNRFVVMTGLSGSGKSSLAIDTIFAEGQRQFIESFPSTPVNYFTNGHAPNSHRSTICRLRFASISGAFRSIHAAPSGTLSEVHDYLEIVVCPSGRSALCPNCGERIQPQTIEEIASRLEAMPQRTKLILLAPLVRGRQGKHVEVFDRVRKARLIRVRVDGHLTTSSPCRRSRLDSLTTIEAIVDRIVIRPDMSTRLIESLRTAVELGEDVVMASCLEPDVDEGDGWRDRNSTPDMLVWHAALISSRSSLARSVSTVHTVPVPVVTD